MSTIVADAWMRLARLGRLPGLRPDRVLLATALLLAGIGLVSPAQLGDTLVFTGQSLLSIGPFLAGSVLLAAYLRAARADQLVARAFSGPQAVMITVAALFGALSPFCSCGVIPLIAALLSLGVPLAPVMAFWLASPLMAPDMFLLTAGEIGLGFAVAKLAAAVGIGLLGGGATWLLARAGGFSTPLREGVGDGGCAGSAVRNPGPVRWRFWQADDGWARLGRFSGKDGLFLFKWLLLAFVLESLMVAYVPADQIAVWLGSGNGWALPLAVVVGVPAYLNGYAAIPLVGGLIGQGMAPGAGLAFMLAGGVTSIPAAMAVFALVRRSVFGWYLALALIGSLLAAAAYQAVV